MPAPFEVPKPSICEAGVGVTQEFDPSEAERCEAMLGDQSTEQLERWEVEARRTVDQELANYKAAYDTFLKRLCNPSTPLRETVMGRVIDECWTAVSMITEELERRDFKLESEESES